MTGFVALYVLLLAAIAGYELISRVPSVMHAPLMSGLGFLNGIVLVGAMVALGQADAPMQRAAGFVAVTLAAINAFGGFVVTRRIFGMVKPARGTK